MMKRLMRQMVLAMWAIDVTSYEYQWYGIMQIMATITPPIDMSICNEMIMA
jgi:hypothetical protein